MLKSRSQSQHSLSREFFLYGLTFIALYIAAFSLGGILFQLINIYLPDPAARDFYYDASRFKDLLRGFASSLIVAGPIFFWLTSKLKREQRVNTALRVSALRRWLTYLTLLIASVVAISDVIGIIYNFLGGELVLRIFAKMAAVLVIAAAVIVYYLRDVREVKE